MSEGSNHHVVQPDVFVLALGNDMAGILGRVCKGEGGPAAAGRE